jgi:L,D-transpeptidase YbiS
MSFLKIIVSAQQMQICDDHEKIVKSYSVSTGKNGVGEIFGSGCTPRGWHIIRAKIGEGYPINAVFRGRRFTGEIYQPGFKEQFPERDWILTRIFWLSGLEVGKNRLGHVDTMRRYVYIHGTPDETILGIPGSKGCIRMKNQDLIELFNSTPVGTKVLIQE